MPEHTCTPPEAASADQDDWCCSTCSQWWAVDQDYCYECGRSGPIEWRKTSAHVQGADRADGSHYLHEPPPFELWELLETSVRRGGSFYGDTAPAPPVPTWIERDAEIKARYARRLGRAQLVVTDVQEDSTGLVASGGWCAPSEPLYRGLT